MTKILLTFAAALATSGCFAVVLPEVKDAAPEAELKKVLDAADRAANPAGKKVRTAHVKAIGHVVKMSMMLPMEIFCRYDRQQALEKVTAPNMPVMCQLFDGKAGWNIVQGVQTKQLSGKRLAQMRFSAKYPDGVKLAEKFENLKLDRNTVDVNGRKCYRLVGQPKDEPELEPQEIFLDAETFLPARIRSIAHTDMGAVPSVTDIQRHHTVNGITIPVLLKQSQLNMEVTIKIMSCKFDVEIPDKTFDREALEDAE